MKWLPGCILSTAAGVLAFRWSDLPPRWAIHWGIGGHADGWATKTPLGVFGLLLLGSAIWIAVEIALRIRQARVRGNGATAVADALRFTQIALAATVALVSVWLPLGRPESPLGMVIVSLVVMGTGIVASMARFSRLQPGVSDSAVSGDQGWNGSIYRNPDDQRLWVPKRSGLGWTLNFAHRLAWPTLLLLLSPAFVTVAAGIVIAAHSRH